jgi:hypothetical protein
MVSHYLFVLLFFPFWFYLRFSLLLKNIISVQADRRVEEVVDKIPSSLLFHIVITGYQSSER